LLPRAPNRADDVNLSTGTATCACRRWHDSQFAGAVKDVALRWQIVRWVFERVCSMKRFSKHGGEAGWRAGGSTFAAVATRCSASFRNLVALANGSWACVEHAL